MLHNVDRFLTTGITDCVSFLGYFTNMQKDLFLVVVSILEGRNFPNRSKFQLIAECRFDGELLSTDPVEHSSAPNFTTELAWELDKKSLHQHRMQRTPIKLQCYAVNISNGVREQIGYILLDLRLAQQKPQSAKWYNLLSSKYSRMKPAIKIGMALEDDHPSQDNAFKAREAPPRIEKLPSSPQKEIIPVLEKDQGYFQIGDPRHCTDMFVLSVTVAFAANLEQLISSDKLLAKANTEFFFYYTLLGNDVTNDPFSNLLNPDFLPERASVRIRSSPTAMRSYFSQPSGNLQMHLCSDDHSFGLAEIPLNSLLKNVDKDLNLKPALIEDAFVIQPTGSTQAGVSAKVGVSICLKKEDFELMSPDGKTGTAAFGSPSIAPLELPEKEKPTNKKTTVPQEEIPFKPDDEPRCTSSPDLTSKPEYRSELPVESKDHDDEESRTTPEPVPPSQAVVSEISTTTSTHPVIPPQAVHFKFSLQFKSLMNVDLPFVCNAYLKYSYPFFGSASPVITHPPIKIPKKIETTLPQSLCTFDFACPEPVLRNTFSRVPLIVELLHADKDSGHMLVANAAIPLQTILREEPTQFTMDSDPKGKLCSRLSTHLKLPLLSVQRTEIKVADLNIAMVLENLGPVHERTVVMKNQKRPTEIAKEKPPTQPRLEDERKSAEYGAAVELELWKEQQERNFENMLREKEISHMQTLAREWQKRDKEREALLAKTLSEYGQLEIKLRKSLTDVEVREKQVRNNEQELLRLRNEIQREREQLMAQAKESTARMKDDCVRQVQLERSRISDLEDGKAKLKSQLLDADRKYAALEQKFEAFKLQQTNMPEVRVQSELQLLTLEKNELERKLETVNKSKLHYKQQWGRALKELAKLKEKEQERAMATLKRQRDELKLMRSRYLADEEREANSRGQKELLELRQELDRIKLKEAVNEGPGDIGIAVAIPGENLAAHDAIIRPSGVSEEHVARLIEERDTLLRTGVYSKQDRIIVELDRQIRESIANKPAL